MNSIIRGTNATLADGSAFAVPVDDWPVMIRMEYNITIY